MLQNIFSTSIIPTSTCSPSTANSSIAAMLSVAMNNSKNLIPNLNVFELLNAPNSSVNNGLFNPSNLLNQANNQSTSLNNPTFINRQNLNLPLIPNNSILPNINGNADLINHIFQQQANVAAATASLNSLCFPPSTSNSHIIGETLQNQQLQNALLCTQNQPPPITINLPPPPLSSSACLAFFPSTIDANLNNLNSTLLSDNCVVPPPPLLQIFHQVNLIYSCVEVFF